MMLLLRLALRNCLRNGRRTILTAFAISVSFALLVVFTGIADGAHEEMADIGVSMGLGHVLVRARGYTDDPTLDHLIPDPEAVAPVLRADPAVRLVAPRLRSDALITAGTTSVGVVLSGVDPAVEAHVSKIDTPASMVAGKSLEPRHSPASRSEPPPVVIGRELARTLGVQVGERVTLTLKPAGGSDTRSGAFRVQGIFATGVHEVDAFWAEAPLGSAAELAGTGGGVTVLAALLDNVTRTEETARRLRAALPEDLEVVPWMQAAPDLYSVIVVDEGGMYAMMAIVFIVVAAGILNTLLMSVLERTHEFGVLLSLGTTPAKVVSIVMCEAVLLGLVATGVGLALGLAGNHHYASVGIDIEGWVGSDFETSGILLPKRLYAHLAPLKAFWSAVAVVFLVVAGAVYPALRAARLEPVEALRHD